MGDNHGIKAKSTTNHNWISQKNPIIYRWHKVAHFQWYSQIIGLGTNYENSEELQDNPFDFLFLPSVKSFVTSLLEATIHTTLQTTPVTYQFVFDIDTIHNISFRENPTMKQDIINNHTNYWAKSIIEQTIM
jgi:hypothetical protein